MLVGSILLGYLIGGIPFAVPVVLLVHGIDVRATGSGNVGARNSLRVGGPVAGALVLVLDALKAAVPMLLVRAAGATPWAVVLMGFGIILGHCYSAYMIAQALRQSWPGWRIASVRVGGQGLASSLGMMLVLAPLLTLPLLLLAAIIIAGFKQSTGAALALIGVGPIAAAVMGYPYTTSIGLALTALVIFSKLLQDLIPLRNEP